MPAIYGAIQYVTLDQRAYQKKSQKADGSRC